MNAGRHLQLLTAQVDVMAIMKRCQAATKVVHQAIDDYHQRQEQKKQPKKTGTNDQIYGSGYLALGHLTRVVH